MYQNSLRIYAAGLNFPYIASDVHFPNLLVKIMKASKVRCQISDFLWVTLRVKGASVLKKKIILQFEIKEV